MAKGIKKLMAGVLAFTGVATMIAMAGMANAEVITDTTAPSKVENLEALPGDASITLTWDAATDDTGVIGYYIYSSLKSVEINGGSYTFGSKDVGNSTSYVMDKLSNGVTYYFSVTAYDSAGNESDYSREASATAEESATGDAIAPTVSSATAVSNSLVEVVFSEPVKLPTDAATAFSLEATDGTAIQVLDAYVSSEDQSTVFLVTDVQIAGAQYMLTAGIGVTDLADNPVESGTSDTAIFTGSALEKATDSGDATTADSEFTVLETSSDEINELTLSFSQDVLTANPASFTIQMADDATATVEVLAVSIDSTDATKVTLITEDMQAGYDYVLSIDDTLVDEAGASLALENRSVDFTAKTVDIADLIAPEDITALLSAISDETSVLLTWTGSANIAGDLAKYLVYQSLDGVTFGGGDEVAPNATEFSAMGLTPGETYTFKVTAVDENGNESDGVMTTITLPESGPELFALLLMAFAGAAFASKRRG